MISGDAGGYYGSEQCARDRNAASIQEQGTHHNSKTWRRRKLKRNVSGRTLMEGYARPTEPQKYGTDKEQKFSVPAIPKRPSSRGSLAASASSLISDDSDTDSDATFYSATSATVKSIELELEKGKEVSFLWLDGEDEVDDGETLYEVEVSWGNNWMFPKEEDDCEDWESPEDLESPEDPWGSTVVSSSASKATRRQNANEFPEHCHKITSTKSKSC